MRQFIFTPGYYEWHLMDKDTEMKLHVMEDPAEATMTENGEPLTLEEIKEYCYSDLTVADDTYAMNEPYNGLLVYSDDRLTAEEMKAASELMGQTLYDYYLKDNDPDSEPLKF